MTNIFETKEKYLEFIAKWKYLTNSEERHHLTIVDYCLYRLMKGKDWTVCFAENTDYHRTVKPTIYWICNSSKLHKRIGGILTEDQINLAREYYNKQVELGVFKCIR